MQLALEFLFDLFSVSMPQDNLWNSGWDTNRTSQKTLEFGFSKNGFKEILLAHIGQQETGINSDGEGFREGFSK